MATAVKSKAQAGGSLNDEEFIAFVKERPHGERWQLIDGDVVMMDPPRLRHQRIAGTLAERLNTHFRRRKAGLFAFHEVGLMVPGVARFRPTADLAVVPDSVDPATIWADLFLLVGEVLSESNSPRQVDRKRLRYMQHPENLYVLVMAQDKVSTVVWSRRLDWEPYELRHLSDKIELPEFNFSISLRTVYAGIADTSR